MWSSQSHMTHCEPNMTCFTKGRWQSWRNCTTYWTNEIIMNNWNFIFCDQRVNGLSALSCSFNPGHYRVSYTTMTIGTPGFQAPEQLKEKLITGKRKVYAFVSGMWFYWQPLILSVTKSASITYSFLIIDKSLIQLWSRRHSYEVVETIVTYHATFGTVAQPRHLF